MEHTPRPSTATSTPNFERDFFSEAPTERLEHELERIERRERRLGSLAVRAEVVLENVERKDLRRQHRVYAAAELIGRRRTTDPFSPDALSYDSSHTLPDLAPKDSFSSKEKYRKDTENTFSMLTTKPLMHRYAKRYSIHRNSPESPRKPSGKDIPPARTSIGRFSDILAARRLERQALRQARAKKSQRLSGEHINAGGKTAKLGTKILRYDLNAESRRRLRAGEITASEHLANRIAAKSVRKVIPSKDVRREINRERIGAIYTLIRAGRPSEGRISKAIRKVATKFKNRVDGKINDLQERRMFIEEELLRRQQDLDRQHTETLDRDMESRRDLPEPPPRIPFL